MNNKIGHIAQVLAVLALIITGCTAPTEDELLDAVLHIHVQAYFDDEEVRVELNDHVVFSERVLSTRSGFAEVAETGEAAFMELPVSRGYHQVRLWEAGVLCADTTFLVQDTLWIGIGRHSDRPQAIIRLRTAPFMYH